MATRKLPTPDRAEIVWIQHDPQAGREMKGMHPMLVLSPKAFVERTGLVIGLPLTHAEINADNPFAVAVQGPKKKKSATSCAINQNRSTGKRGAAGGTPGALYPSPSCGRRWIDWMRFAGFVNTDRCK